MSEIEISRKREELRAPTGFAAFLLRPGYISSFIAVFTAFYGDKIEPFVKQKGEHAKIIIETVINK